MDNKCRLRFQWVIPSLLPLSDRQISGTRLGTQDMACSWTGVAFLGFDLDRTVDCADFGTHHQAYSVPMGVLGGSFAGISGAFWERGVSPPPLRAEYLLPSAG